MNDKRYSIRLFAVIALLLVIINVWIYKITHGSLPYVDEWTRGIVPKVADTPLYTFFRWVTELGSESFVIPFTIVMVIVFALVFRDWLAPILFGVGVLGAHILNTVIKQMVARERPSISALLNAEGYSFPSGHSMVSMVCYGLIAFLLIKKVKSTKQALLIQCTFALVIFLIGISRFFINVHFLTDIISGFTLGFICLLVFMYLYEYIQMKRSRS